jgi:protein tyrosine phosphatase (PTP) superfamily phosphohydrolase (DUF442 family)
MRKLAPVVVLLVVVGCKPSGGQPAPGRPVEAAGIQHAFQVSDNIYSGSGPAGDVGFASLQALGVKTIISVDGATPDVAAAKRHGLTYVHLPVGYDGIPRHRVVALVKAATTLPGPIYVHCHHGKHRGPAAVAVIQLCTNPTWDAEKAEAWLAAAGTDPKYTSLMAIPRTLERPTAEELAAAPVKFPEVTPVPDLTRVMAAIDKRWDLLTKVRDAGWATPADHPDLDPAHEALQLVELYQEAARLPDVQRRGPEFLAVLKDAERAARELEAALRAEIPAHMRSRIGAAYAFNAAACSNCHNHFRGR